MDNGIRTDHATVRLEEGVAYLLQYGLSALGIPIPCPDCGGSVSACSSCGKVIDLATETALFLSLVHGARTALVLHECRECLEKHSLRVPVAESSPVWK